MRAVHSLSLIVLNYVVLEILKKRAIYNYPCPSFLVFWQQIFLKTFFTCPERFSFSVRTHFTADELHSQRATTLCEFTLWLWTFEDIIAGNSKVHLRVARLQAFCHICQIIRNQRNFVRFEESEKKVNHEAPQCESNSRNIVISDWRKYFKGGRATTPLSLRPETCCNTNHHWLTHLAILSAYVLQ